MKDKYILKKFSFNITEAEHKALRTYSVRHDIDMTKIIKSGKYPEAIKEYMNNKYN